MSKSVSEQDALKQRLDHLGYGKRSGAICAIVREWLQQKQGTTTMEIHSNYEGCCYDKFHGSQRWLKKLELLEDLDK